MIMLACVIAVPLVALSGTSLPDAVKRFFDTRAGINSASSPKPAQDLAPPSASREPMSMASTDTLAPRRVPQTSSDVPVCSDGGCPLPIASRPAETIASRADIIPTAFTQPSAQPHFPEGDPVRGANPALAEICPNPEAAARLAQVQERLQQLGAVHYSLQAWGAQSGFYKFQCRMATGADRETTRYFEAFGADGVETMCQVLAAVEAWRASVLQ